MCRPIQRQYLLTLKIYDLIKGVKMRSKEYILTTAMILLITYTLSLSLVSQAFTAGQTTKTLSSTGSIQIQTSEGIGIYSNAQGTVSLTSIEWGTLTPGGSNSITCYIKNEGSSPVTLAMQTSDWQPISAQNYITLSWNYNAQSISPNQVVQVTLTLSVNPNIQGITNFGFDITIVGSS